MESRGEANQRPVDKIADLIWGERRLGNLSHRAWQDRESFGVGMDKDRAAVLIDAPRSCAHAHADRDLFVACVTTPIRLAADKTRTAPVDTRVTAGNVLRHHKRSPRCLAHYRSPLTSSISQRQGLLSAPGKIAADGRDEMRYLLELDRLQTGDLHYLGGLERAGEVELIGFEIELVSRIDALHLLAVATLDSAGGEITLHTRRANVRGGLGVGDLAGGLGIIVSRADAHAAGELIVFDVTASCVAQDALAHIGGRIVDADLACAARRRGDQPRSVAHDDPGSVFRRVEGTTGQGQDVALGLREAQVILFAPHSDVGLLLAEAAVGQVALRLLLAVLFDQAAGGYALCLGHLHRQGVAARDRAQSLRPARGCRLQAKNLLGAICQIARVFDGQRARLFGLILAFDARLARLALQSRPILHAGDLQPCGSERAKPTRSAGGDSFKDLPEGELVADVRRSQQEQRAERHQNHQDETGVNGLRDPGRVAGNLPQRVEAEDAEFGADDLESEIARRVDGQAEHVADERCDKCEHRRAPRERVRDALRQAAVYRKRNGEGSKQPQSDGDECAEQGQKEVGKFEQKPTHGHADEYVREIPGGDVEHLGDVAEIRVLARQRADGLVWVADHWFNDEHAFGELLVVGVELDFSVPEDLPEFGNVDDVIADLTCRIDDRAPAAEENEDHGQPGTPPEEVFARAVVLAEEPRKRKEHDNDRDPEGEVFQTRDQRAFNRVLQLRDQILGDERQIN